MSLRDRWKEDSSFAFCIGVIVGIFLSLIAVIVVVGVTA